MMHVHLSGYLVKTPEQKTSSKGTPYGKALLLCAAGDSEQLINLTVFDDALQTLLASLQKGDSISAMGTLSVKPWSKEGEPQAGLSLVANRIMALADKQAKPRSKAPSGNGRQQHARSAEFQSAGRREFASIDDEIPF